MLDGFCVKEVQTAPEQSCKLPLRLFYILPTCLSTWIYLSIELSGCIFSPNLDVCWCVFFFFREKNCRARYLRLTRWRDDFIGESKSACAAHGSAPCWGLTSCNFHRIAPRFFFLTPFSPGWIGWIFFSVFIGCLFKLFLYWNFVVCHFKTDVTYLSFA